MTHRGKTKTGGWVIGFLIAYYKEIERIDIEDHQIFEGIRGIPPISVLPDTICEYVCKDLNGEDSFIGDIVRLENGDNSIMCFLLKTDIGYEIQPNFQRRSLWGLKIINGVGNFTVVGNKFDNPDMAEALYKKKHRLKERMNERWQNFSM